MRISAAVSSSVLNARPMLMLSHSLTGWRHRLNKRGRGALSHFRCNIHTGEASKFQNSPFSCHSRSPIPQPCIHAHPTTCQTKDVQSRLASICYFTQPGGTAEAFMTNLQRKEELPGFPKANMGRLVVSCAGAN